jgi:hypothetical protein
MFEKYSSLLRSALNMDSFCQQYPSCEKLKLFELRYTSGPSILYSSLFFAYIALYRAECLIGQTEDGPSLCIYLPSLETHIMRIETATEERSQLNILSGNCVISGLRLTI